MFNSLKRLSPALAGLFGLAAMAAPGLAGTPKKRRRPRGDTSQLPAGKLARKAALGKLGLSHPSGLGPVPPKSKGENRHAKKRKSTGGITAKPLSRRQRRRATLPAYSFKRMSQGAAR